MDNRSERSRFFRSLSLKSKTGSVSTKMSDNDTIKASPTHPTATTPSSGESSKRNMTISSKNTSIVVSSPDKDSDDQSKLSKPASLGDSKDDIARASSSSSGQSNPLQQSTSSKPSTRALRMQSSASSMYGNNARMGVSGHRGSIISDYSGIVQNVDIDTIKYVGNKESLQLSGTIGTRSSSDEMLVVHPAYVSRNNSIVSMGSANLPPSKLSPRKSVNNENIAKVLRNHQEKSPIKSSGTPPPKSPLPKLNKYSFENVSPTASPLKHSAKHRSLSSTSSSGSSIQEQLDEILKEVEVLKSGLNDDSNYKYSKFSSSIPLNQKKPTNESAVSMSSTGTSLYGGTSSFHTANNSMSSLRQEEFQDVNEASINRVSSARAENIVDDYDLDEPTENLHLKLKTPPRTSKATLDPSKVQLLGLNVKEITSQKDNSKENDHGSELIKDDTEIHHSSKKTHKKKSKSTCSHKSKRKSTSSSKGKIKPFSYETLAKLLNATDGIILGQEFATLNIPTEEKFLIERIVDSISRLTANMMLNPARYDQSCARLERVLNVLEGFD